ANEPNLASIASFKAPVGSPPAFAANCSQNNVWLACPPTLLRTAVFLSSGTASKLDKISSADLSAKSVPSKAAFARSEEHTSELQSRFDLVCRLLLENKKNT